MRGPREESDARLDPQVRSASHRRSVDRRVSRVALSISVAAHLVLLLVYSVVVKAWSPVEAVLSPSSVGPTSLQGIRIVNIDEQFEGEQLVVERPPIPEDEEQQVEEEEQDAVEDAAQVEGAEVSPEAEPRRRGVLAAERLRVRMEDERLFRPAAPEVYTITDEERMRLALAGRIDAYNDSVAAMAAIEAGLTDWTRTDSDGNRWGVSPGKLHLGKLTLPLPFGFGQNGWQRARSQDRAWRIRDIERGVVVQDELANLRERAREIRKRKEEEREPPDTTRGGG